ncbi:hypothetical protein L596_028846 [Steinernema carpocapsae]|uniref:Uncharacterized protein n=1 Tax=Steinernema carpocapsae TaxID=34508 RepID=A0A4U5LZP5_STECR|nr:hypothetical protein L596_028846 [Steinernema carpocapsae]
MSANVCLDSCEAHFDAFRRTRATGLMSARKRRHTFQIVLSRNMTLGVRDTLPSRFRLIFHLKTDRPAHVSHSV